MFSFYSFTVDPGHQAFRDKLKDSISGLCLFPLIPQSILSRCLFFLLSKALPHPSPNEPRPRGRPATRSGVHCARLPPHDHPGGTGRPSEGLGGILIEWVPTKGMGFEKEEQHKEIKI